MMEYNETGRHLRNVRLAAAYSMGWKQQVTLAYDLGVRHLVIPGYADHKLLPVRCWRGCDTLALDHMPFGYVLLKNRYTGVTDHLITEEEYNALKRLGEIVQ